MNVPLPDERRTTTAPTHATAPAKTGELTVPIHWLRTYADLAITPTEMMTLLHIWQYHRDDNTAQVALATVARQMGLSRRQVRTHIASLRSKNLILTDQRSTDRAGQTASCYDLTPFIDHAKQLPRQDSSYPPGNDPSYPTRNAPADGSNLSPTRIAERIEAISALLGDAQHTASNRTRAHRLWQHSPLTVEAFLDILDEALDAARRAPNVRHRGETGQPNRMPYFFACLRNLLADEEKPRQPHNTHIQPAVAYLIAEANKPALPLHKHPVWTEVAAQLRETMTRENYIKWIQPTRVLAEQPGLLTIQAPDQLHAMWLSAKLERPIRDALARIGHPHTRCIFIPKENR